MKLAKLEITGELFLQAMRLPPDTVFHGTAIPTDPRNLAVFIEHPGLAYVPPGSHVPNASAEFKRKEPPEHDAEFVRWIQ